jgi:hypothetical protein
MAFVLRRVAALLLATSGLAAWWYWRIVVPAVATRVPIASFDDYVYYYPTLHYGFGELRAGRLPLWNPYQHAGSPFFATAQHVLLYPLNLPYLLLPTGEAETVAAILHLLLALGGTMLLARTLGQRWASAAVAGIAFTLSPPVITLTFLPHHLYALAWLPLELALAHRVCAQPARLRWAALLGACAGFQYLGGYPMFVVMSAYAVFAYCVWRLWGSWRSAAERRRLAAAALALGAAGLLAASLSAPQLLPALELAQVSVRAEPLSFEAAAINSGQPAASLLRALLPMRDDPLGTSPTWMPYVGVPALLLAIFALLAAPRRSGTPFFVGFTAVAWLVGLGANAPLFAVYYHLPAGDAFRCPYRFFPLAVLGLGVLAGFGADALWTAARRMRVAAWLRWLLLALGGIAVGLGTVVPLPAPAGPPLGVSPITIAAMPAVPLGPATVALGWYLIAAALWLSLSLRAGRRGRALLAWSLPLIVYASLFVAVRNWAPIPPTHPELHTMPEPAAQYLRERQGLDRTFVVLSSWPFGPPGRYLPARAGILHGLYVVGDRENVYPLRFAQYGDRLLTDAMREGRVRAEQLGLPPYLPQGELLATAQSPNLRLLDLLGVRFVVQGPGSDFEQAAAPQRFPLRFEQDDVRIYENVEALPRAFVVHDVAVVPADQVLDRLTAAGLDPRRTAIVERAPPIAPQPTTQASTVRIAEYAADRVVVDVETPAAGLLVLTDQHYPGWQARVDGRPAEILITDYLFRGVALNAGRHQVVFEFAPRSVRRGIEIGATGLGLFALVALAATWQRRRRQVRG